jgi:hypothetical protein
MPLSLTNPWIIIGLIGMGGLIFWWGDGNGASRCEAAHTAAALAETRQVLDDFVKAGKDMNGIAGKFTVISQDLSTEIDAISGKFRNGARQNPLPVDCRPDPFRVQSLSSAIAATNSAIGRGPGPAVPPN